jgi:hypothetical protein
VLASSGAERIVVAGPGQTKDRFANRLPDRLTERVIAVEDIEDAGAEGALRRFVELGRAHEAPSSRAVAAARAAREGRVDLLVVRDGLDAGGAECEAHEAFFEVGGVGRGASVVASTPALTPRRRRRRAQARPRRWPRPPRPRRRPRRPGCRRA